MAIALVVLLANLGLFPPDGSTATTADVVTFRDGKILLGQVVESDRRAPLLVLVRRAWAEKNLTDRWAHWEQVEAPITRRAEQQRRDRLEAWKRERGARPADDDRLTSWIDQELTRMSHPDPTRKSALMLVKIGRTEVRTIDRKSRKSNRLLRLGWISDFPDVETMKQADLIQAVEGRGYTANSETSVSLDPRLPTPLEDDTRWLVRRASTEIINERGARLLRYQGMVMAEPAAGEAPPAGAALNAALGGLKELLGEAPTDPLPGKLRELAGQGRVGAVVTRLEMSPDFSSTSVESTLWVRFGDRWNPAFSRSSSIRVDDLPANAGTELVEDPQVKAVFGAFDSLGLGQVPSEMKRRSLNMGAATRQALGQARGALDLELNVLAMPLEKAQAGGPSGGP